MESTGYYDQARLEMKRFLPANYSKVLEVGCGIGTFSKSLRDDSERWGIEPVKHVAEQASGHLKTVLVGTFEEVYDQLPDGYFDLVICNDVIEHMADHEKFLRAVSKKMASGAHIVGSVPNLRYIAVMYKLLFRKDFHYENSGPLDRTHLRFFTQKSLRDSLVTTGLEVEDLRGINSTISSVKSVNHAVVISMALLTSILSLGFHSDVRFRQIAFRARKTTD